MDKKLHRSQSDKIIAGVCGGLAEYFGIDSTLMRLGFILIVILGGSGVLLYFILWLIMPKDANSPAVINKERVKEFADEIKDKAQELKEGAQKHYESYSHNHVCCGEKHQRGSFWGWVLLILGVAFLANNLMPYWFTRQLLGFWPLIFIVGGLMLIAGAHNKHKKEN
ncbi:MAG TPA: PspC domain-containing protein [Candidatus Portnoybacteria bacterium]|nr:PspC domain-containing protein [Candidatus Portnoybacteria bacterium]